jgi:sarcosine oxidase subunit alpha
MPETFDVRVNGRALQVEPGTSAAVALMIAAAWRTSVKGEARAPVCGMGVCFECRANVDGLPHVKTCQVLCRPGMSIICHD